MPTFIAPHLSRRRQRRVRAPVVRIGSVILFILGTLALVASGASVYFGTRAIQARADKFDEAYSFEMAMSKEYRPVPKAGYSKAILVIVLGLLLLLVSVVCLVVASTG